MISRKPGEIKSNVDLPKVWQKRAERLQGRRENVPWERSLQINQLFPDPEISADHVHT